MISGKSQISNISPLGRLRGRGRLPLAANVRRSELNYARVEEVLGGELGQYQRGIHAEYGGNPLLYNIKELEGTSLGEMLRDSLFRAARGAAQGELSGAVKNVFNQGVGMGGVRGGSSRGQYFAELGAFLTRAINRNS